MQPVRKKPKLGRIPMPKKPPKVEIPRNVYKRDKKAVVEEVIETPDKETVEIKSGR